LGRAARQSDKSDLQRLRKQKQEILYRGRTPLEEYFSKEAVFGMPVRETTETHSIYRAP
jgi:hypothetical protein